MRYGMRRLVLTRIFTVKISGICNKNHDNVEGNPTPVILKFEWELWQKVQDTNLFRREWLWQKGGL